RSESLEWRIRKPRSGSLPTSTSSSIRSTVMPASPDPPAAGGGGATATTSSSTGGRTALAGTPTATALLSTVVVTPAGLATATVSAAGAAWAAAGPATCEGGGRPSMCALTTACVSRITGYIT